MGVHVHTKAYDSLSGEIYCKECGEILGNSESKENLTEREGVSGFYNTTRDKYRVHTDITPSGRKIMYRQTNKERTLNEVIKSIDLYVRENNLLFKDADLNNVVYYAGRYYDFKSKNGVQPHIKSRILNDLLFLNYVQKGMNNEANKIKPVNNSEFIKLLYSIGLKDSDIKQVFANYPLILRWI